MQLLESLQLPRLQYPVWRRCTVRGLPGICHWRELGADGLLDCSIDGELTVSGEPRHDLWHPDHVVLGGRLT